MFLIWKESLIKAFNFYQAHKPENKKLVPWLFLFFVIINAFCYWWASLTAFSSYIRVDTFYYFKIQFPVAILGALFDCLSFFITIKIIEFAIKSTTPLSFVAHLSIDLLIAIAATFWVVFVFSFSSWLIRLTELDEVATQLSTRQNVYQDRLESAISNPTSNKRNIYFGLVMGVSAMLPTCFHIYMAFKSLFNIRSRQLALIENKVGGWVGRKMMRLRDSQQTDNPG